ncbi:MAG TPA: hypothetical protein VEA19_00415, partial [Actinomycetota bacterium]|nr:hypothetical protein [Actinomycetota bacterium]
MAPVPPARKQRKWLPPIAVFLVVSFVTLGGFFAAGDAATQISSVGAPGPPPPAAAPVEVAPGVSL